MAVSKAPPGFVIAVRGEEGERDIDLTIKQACPITLALQQGFSLARKGAAIATPLSS